MSLSTHILFSLQFDSSKIIYPLSNYLINCIPPRSASQILSIKRERTFRFSNFQVIGLCSCSANSLLEIIYFLTGPLEAFLLKNV